MELTDIIDLESYPITDPAFRSACKAEFDAQGIFVMPAFLKPEARDTILQEGLSNQDKVYAKTEQHTVYLSKPDASFTPDHPRNRMVTSSKGCITDDLMPQTSPLRALYNAQSFRSFLCEVMDEEALYEYADPMSSINLHFAQTGQELGWHFDNSSFAITLMIQAPEAGGLFEYVKDTRDADAGEMGFAAVANILDGKAQVQQLAADAGTMVFFRGRNSIHRVAPNEGARTRILAVLAYNNTPGVSLSKEAQKTFYGRTA